MNNHSQLSPKSVRGHHYFFSKKQLLVLSVIIFTWLISSCNFTQFTSFLTSTQTPQPTQELPTPQPQAMVTFLVLVPQDVAIGEKIYLNILDEVTGLALNPKRYEMQAVNQREFMISLPLEVDSIIKYRFSRRGAYIFEEHTNIHVPVRYRMYYVEGPGVIQDVVSAWSDTSYTEPAGRITGIIINALTNQPIPGLLVTAGGAQTLTRADGSFLIEQLPPATHNLVVSSMDGFYPPFQQGAVVAAEATTPAHIALYPRTPVNIIFVVSVPDNNLPGVPIRLAGNLVQLGNTFATLSGGVSTLATRMPILNPLPDGRYSVQLTLPVGAEILYKYTLGDGFWNAEHTNNGNFVVRRLIVPPTSSLIEDRVETWADSARGPIFFDTQSPSNTPEADFVSIQLGLVGWTEPIPMWKLAENHWAYLLYSPLSVVDNLTYRYCRNQQCGSADDGLTPGNINSGRTMTLKSGPQIQKDSVSNWAWMDPFESPDLPPVEIVPRGSNFMAGIELQTLYHPSWTPLMTTITQEIQALDVNWMIFNPTWTYTLPQSPQLEPFTGTNPLWKDSVFLIESAHASGMRVALQPTPLPLILDDWWINSNRDFSWWVSWFAGYRNFILHHADLAQTQNVEALILGGNWLTPALPGGTLADGSPSGTPTDAEQRWRDLVAEVRTHYSGTILWALAYPQGIAKPPPFLDAIDKIYLLFSAPIAESKDASLDEMQKQASAILKKEIEPFQKQTRKPVILVVAYPSADGGATGCVLESTEISQKNCLDTNLLERPNEDISSVQVDLQEQALAYQALLIAINKLEWLNGFVSAGYYPPAALRDKSISIHGKLAANVLKFWFSGFLINPDSPK